MAEPTTRRRLLSATAALLGAIGAYRASARLLGGKESKGMQSTVSDARQVRGIARIISPSSRHWVGDGFHVHGVLSPTGDPAVQSPFLLLDHAARRHFEPQSRRRGVGEHPHRGFETVTFAYRGEIEHRDSSGGGGTIGPGDVQWMTAASGLVHEEMHSQRFSEQGGELEMVQLWVNLPARAKMSAPGYQSLLDRDFPRTRLGAAEARVIAGTLKEAKGPARTHTPITIFDLTFESDGVAEFELPAGHNSLLFGLEQNVTVGDKDALEAGQLAVLRHEAGVIRVRAARGARLLVLSGEPIDEPVASYGPFVMNTQEQLLAAVRDYQSGKMGHLQ